MTLYCARSYYVFEVVALLAFVSLGLAQANSYDLTPYPVYFVAFFTMGLFVLGLRLCARIRHKKVLHLDADGMLTIPVGATPLAGPRDVSADLMDTEIVEAWCALRFDPPVRFSDGKTRRRVSLTPRFVEGGLDRVNALLAFAAEAGLKVRRQ